MTLSNIFLGFTIGIPLMLIAGPVSMMLLDRGLTQGVRGVAPAVVGVAGADLFVTVVASLGAGAVMTVMVPFEGVLTTFAVLVLAAIAAWMWRGASRELVALRLDGPAVRRSERGAVQLVGTSHVHDPVPGPTGASPTGTGPADIGSAGVGGPTEIGGTADGGLVSSLEGARLAGAFFAITAVNPLSLALLISIIVAGGPGVGTVGWALGMALSAAAAHAAYGFAGAAIGSRLDPVGVAKMRLGGAVLVAAMAVALQAGLI